MCAALHEYRPLVANEEGCPASECFLSSDPIVGPSVGPHHPYATDTTNPTTYKSVAELGLSLVTRLGIEPRTYGLKVRCSTN